MRMAVTAAMLALGPTVCGPTGADSPECEPCTLPQICLQLCVAADPGVVSSGCVTPLDGGYVARDGGRFVACPR